MTVRSGSRATNTGSRTAHTSARSTDTGARTAHPGARAEVFRLAPPLVFWWLWVVFVLANLIDFAVQGAQARFVVVVSAILAACTGLAYALALRPRVLADQAGITVLNPFRTHHVPWQAVRSVDVAEWVRVHYAQDKTINCWALLTSARQRQGGGQTMLARTARGFARTVTAEGGVSRLPEEARQLASLPPSRAIAARLDALARKARGASGGAAVTSRWSWPAIAAVVIPAASLAIVLAA